jgi:hypothetical protein
MCWHLASAWIFQIHMERGKTQGQRCTSAYMLQRKNRMHAFIYLHPDCIVSRCYKVARAAQLMWRVLCAVQLPLRAALFPFPHFHRYIWPLEYYFDHCCAPLCFAFIFNTITELCRSYWPNLQCKQRQKLEKLMLAHICTLSLSRTCGLNRRL